MKQEASEDSQPESSARKSGTLKKPMKNFFITPKTPSSSQKLKIEEKDAPGASLAPHIPFKIESSSPSQAPLPSSSAEGSSIKRERSEEGGDEELARKLARMDRLEEEGDEELARKLEMEERLLPSPLAPRAVGSMVNTPKSVKGGRKRKPCRRKERERIIKEARILRVFFGNQ